MPEDKFASGIVLNKPEKDKANKERDKQRNTVQGVYPPPPPPPPLSATLPLKAC
jgi:hypothetical protein